MGSVTKIYSYIDTIGFKQWVRPCMGSVTHNETEKPFYNINDKYI